MSSYRALIFRESHPDKAWSATAHGFTLIVRRAGTGYLAFLQKWSAEAGTYILEPVVSDGQPAVFACREDAESACQKRYEQELRWMNMRSR